MKDEFSKWWEKEVGTTGKWSILERMAALDAWNYKDKEIKEKEIIAKTEVLENIIEVCDSYHASNSVRQNIERKLKYLYVERKACQ